MTRTILDDAKPATSTKTKRVAIVGAWFLVLLGVLALALLGAFSWDENGANLLRLAFWVATGTAVLVSVYWFFQGRFGHKFRAPTGKEIGADLVVALLGVPFALPLLIVALDGAVLPWSDRITPAALAVVGILFPVLRPRRV